MNIEPIQFPELQKSFQAENITTQITLAGIKLYINRQTIHFEANDDRFSHPFLQDSQGLAIKKQEEQNDVPKTKTEMPVQTKYENPKNEETTERENAKTEAYAKYENPSLKSEESSLYEEPWPESQLPIITLEKDEWKSLDPVLNTELTEMLNFILSNMGKLPEAEIQNFRSRYQGHAILLQIFDKLVMKYYSASKTKEDIVRYIMRRVFKTLKASIMMNEKVSPQKASILLCEKYFKINLDETQDQSVNNNQNNKKDGILGFFAPDTKIFKTINKKFVKEVFSSQDFCEEYKRFLTSFHNVLSYDNNKKKKKFIQFLVSCVKKGCLGDIGKYNRLPWLDTWIENTKDIAKNLLSKNSVYKWKKHKKQ